MKNKFAKNLINGSDASPPTLINFNWIYREILLENIGLGGRKLFLLLLRVSFDRTEINHLNYFLTNLSKQKSFTFVFSIINHSLFFHYRRRFHFHLKTFLNLHQTIILARLMGKFFIVSTLMYCARCKFSYDMKWFMDPLWEFASLFPPSIHILLCNIKLADYWCTLWVLLVCVNLKR